ncbi:MAG TPA: squalene synthase HpnC [Solirubrobacterales bacterium]|nr:squalene synthase HpnC [Solirubrobacterales bacterium]
MSATAAATTLPSRAAVMAQAGDENFPVGGRLLAGPAARDLLAIYGFARLVDDIGDELDGDRVALLDWAEEELDRIYSGARPEHEVMRALAASVSRRSLPRRPFELLIAANRRDQEVGSYETFEDLLAYCELSAAPVGELVLEVFEAATPRRLALAGQVCAGLQVVEHLQDVAEDHARGRVYLPRRDMARFDCGEAELEAPTASPRLRALIAFEAGRADALLAAGVPLVGELRGRARLTVSAFLAGGRATLAALGDAGWDVLGARPRRSRGGFAIQFLRSVTGR